jgi:hypothetical protein
MNHLGRVWTGLLVWAAAAMLGDGAAQAHHSFAMFDTSKCLTLTGTVRKFEWGFPHTWIWINVPNKTGAVDAWGFEGEPPADLSRWGWRKNTLKKGDKVTVKYSPMRGDKKAGAFNSVTLADGRVMPGNRDACSKSGEKSAVPDTTGAKAPAGASSRK